MKWFQQKTHVGHGSITKMRNIWEKEAISEENEYPVRKWDCIKRNTFKQNNIRTKNVHKGKCVKRKEWTSNDIKIKEMVENLMILTEDKH